MQRQILTVLLSITLSLEKVVTPEQWESLSIMCQVEGKELGPARLQKLVRSHTGAAKQLRAKGYWKKEVAGLLVVVRAIVTVLEAQDVEEERQQELREAELLALRPCANPLCTYLSGCSEGRLRGRRCGGCRVVHYCSLLCQSADYPKHSRVCGQLVQQHVAGQKVAAEGPSERLPNIVGRALLS